MDTRSLRQKTSRKRPGPASEQDWARYERFLLQTGMKQKAAAKMVKYQRKQANRTKFKPVIGSNGQVAFCNDTWGGKYGCSIGLDLGKTQPVLSFLFRPASCRKAKQKRQQRCHCSD